MVRRIAMLIMVLAHGTAFSQPPLDLFDQQPQAKDLDAAQAQLQGFLNSEKKFPQRYAAKSIVEISSRVGQDSSETHTTQWIVIDETRDCWLAEVKSKVTDARGNHFYESSGYWNQGKFWIKDNDGFEFASDWQVGNLADQNQFFHPRFCWTTTARDFACSFQETSELLLAGKDCVAVVGLGRLSGSYWTNKKATGLNRITGVFLDGNGTLSHAKLLPSLKGNFEIAAYKRIQKESGFEVLVDLKWNQLDPRTKLLTRVDSRESNAAGDVVHTKIKSQWLLGTDVGDEYFADPRSGATPSLKKLNFEQR